MRALQLVDDQKLEKVDLPEPDAPASGEVTLRVKAMALNPTDVWGWRGMAFAKCKMPFAIGAEASGVVETIGPAVYNVLCGQLISNYGARACGLCKRCDNLCEHVQGVHGFHLDGFAQEKINIPARQLVPAPPGVVAIAAALAPMTFGTIVHTLFDNAKLQPCETILVHASGSGIGSAAIQLAKKTGLHIHHDGRFGRKDRKSQGPRRRLHHQLPHRSLRRRSAQVDEEKGYRCCLRTCRQGHRGGIDIFSEAWRPPRHLRFDLRRFHRDQPDDALPTAAEAAQFLRLSHGKHGGSHAENGARRGSSGDRNGSDFRRYRPGAGTHGNPQMFGKIILLMD